LGASWPEKAGYLTIPLTILGRSGGVAGGKEEGGRSGRGMECRRTGSADRLFGRGHTRIRLDALVAGLMEPAVHSVVSHLYHAADSIA